MTDILKRIEALEAELVKLKADAQAEQSGGYWVPKKGERYHILTTDGLTGNPFYDSSYDERAVFQGNAFRTAVEAERERKRREVMHRLRVLAKGFKPDWNDHNQMKWYFYYAHGAKTWKGSAAVYEQNYGQVYFATKADRDAAMAELGPDLDYLL